MCCGSRPATLIRSVEISNGSSCIKKSSNASSFVSFQMVGRNGVHELAIPLEKMAIDVFF